MQLYDRIPPQDLEAERAVLGACLLEHDALGTAIEILRADDFYDLNHRSAFETMLDMYATARPVDLVTIKDELDRRGIFERVGGQPFLGSLVAAVPTTANVEYHAEIIKEKSIRRRLIDAGSKIVSLAYSSDQESAMIVDEAEQTIFEVAHERNRIEFRPVSEILGAAFEKIEQRYQQSGSDVSGFESSFADLDNLIGGFQPGSLNIIAARPSMGKTAFALNIAQFGGGAPTRRS